GAVLKNAFNSTVPYIETATPSLVVTGILVVAAGVGWGRGTTVCGARASATVGGIIGDRAALADPLQTSANSDSFSSPLPWRIDASTLTRVEVEAAVTLATSAAVMVPFVARI